MAGHKKTREERAAAREALRAEREAKARAEQMERQERKKAGTGDGMGTGEPGAHDLTGETKGEPGSTKREPEILGTKGKKGTKGEPRAKREPVELTPEQKVKKEVTGIGTRMKKLLRDGGKYDAALTYQVEQAATTLTITRKIAAEIMKEGASAITEETSREGAARVKINPLFELYLKYDSANRHNLRALAMNRENMKTADDQLDDGEDGVIAMVRKISGEENDNAPDVKG